MQTQPVPLSAVEDPLLKTHLLDSVEQAVLAVDQTGRIVFWNRFAEKLLGWTLEEVQGRSINHVLAAPQLLETALINLNRLQSGEGWSGEFLVQHLDRTSFMAHIHTSLVQNEQRSLLSMVIIPQDNSERQPLQEANRLLAEAGARLMDVVDYEAPLTTLVQLAVPQIADWCAVHLLRADGSLEQVVLAPVEISKLQEANDWLQNHLPNDDAEGLPAVLRSGESKLVANVAPKYGIVSPAIKSYMIVPLIVRPKTFGAITFVAAESGRRFDLTTLALAENLVSHIAIYLDKARLYHESQRLNAELEQRVSERTAELCAAVEHLKQSESTIQTLFRISNKLNATLDMGTILDGLAQEAIRLVKGESGFAGLSTSDSMTMSNYFQKGVAVPFEYSWPLGKGIPGWVLQHKVPYGNSDAAHDPIMLHELAINVDVRSIICTPILDSNGEVLGYFDIRNKQGTEGFTISDQEMLMALAPVASIAIQNALAYQQHLLAEAELKESYERLRSLAANLESVREEQRTQIARDLHDQLGQALTAMKFDLAWLTNRLVEKDATLAQKAKTVTAQMDTMIKTVRRIATELRPAMLDDLGLAASIEWQARDFEKRTGIKCTVDVYSEDLPLARPQSIALFRIFQESITNVTRHASAKQIDIKLFASNEVLTLQIHDDGRGIKEQEIVSRQSLGLLGMRERAKHLGGTFEIQAVPSNGTMITVTIPIKQSE